MDAQTYKDRHGVAICRAVADKAGTNYIYFYQIAVGLRHPSRRLTEKLVLASRKVTPAAPLTAAKLCPKWSRLRADVWD